jgi:quinol monooxygenase YgiN
MAFSFFLVNEDTAKFAYIWEYVVKDDQLDQFCSVYGPQGAWAQLFSRASGYLSTELHRDLDEPNHFLTIDYWASREARDHFRDQFAAEFEALDQACEAFTIEERFIGDFELNR